MQRFSLSSILAIEVKGTDLVMDLKGIRALKEEGLIENYGVISLDAHERVTSDGIYIWPWRIFLDRLWQRQLL